MSKVFHEDALRSASWLVIGKIFSFIIYFVISVMIIKGLGKEDYGLFVVSKSIGCYLLIACALGLNTCILRYIPEMAAKKNIGQIKKFIYKSLKYQLCTLILILTITVLLREKILGSLNSGISIIFCLAMWIGVILWKNILNDTLTALFKSKTVALFSMAQAVIWLLLLVQYNLTVEMVFLIEAAATFTVSAASMFYLNKKVLSAPGKDSGGIDSRRVRYLAAPVLANGLLRNLMLQYTEIFFLGLFFAPAVAGFYELGYSTPLLAITFIPMAVQSLFSSAFAEAYTRDNKLLKEMVSKTYKMIIILCVPLACLGFIHSPFLIETIYGKEMSQAGKVASYFSIIHLFPLLSMPLSMAITTMEKNAKTLWLLVLQVIVNIALDIVLIPLYGLIGAVAAVSLTFILTIPIRLYVTRKLIGGIWFPFTFFVKYTIVCVVSISAAVNSLNVNSLADFAASLLIFIAIAFLLCIAAGLLKGDFFKMILKGKIKAAVDIY